MGMNGGSYLCGVLEKLCIGQMVLMGCEKFFGVGKFLNLESGPLKGLFGNATKMNGKSCYLYGG